MRKSLVAISALVVGLGAAVFVALHSPRANANTNLVEDPGFETSLSNFEPNQSGTSVNVTTNNPISGSRSLVVGTTGYGDSILWAGKDLASFSTRRSNQVSASARIKATVASTSKIKLCVLINYADGEFAMPCSEVTGSVGDKSTVTVSAALNSSKDIEQVRLGIFQEGSAALSGVLVDDVSVVLAGVSASAPTPVNGSCGASNNTTVASAPSSNLCSSGSASAVSGSGPWSWTCVGSNGGSTASCSAQTSQTNQPTPVNGVCGSANNTSVSAAPTNNLCSAGSASSVAGSGPWTWSCAGSNGGSNASCSASTAQNPVTNFVLTITKTGNGTITSNPSGINCGTSCSANFSNNTSVTLTATSVTGNTFAGWTGACSGTGTCTVSMTAARTVGATFSASTNNPPPTSASGENLIEEPGFEQGTSNFEPNQAGTSVNVTVSSPISGSRSLVINTVGYGDSILWGGRELANFTTRRSDRLVASIKVRSTVASASAIKFCALINYADGEFAMPCSEVSATVGDKGTVTVNAALNSSKDIGRVRVGIFQEGSARLQNVMLDDASIVLNGITLPAAAPAPTPVNGVCGSSNTATLSAAPTSGLCATGSASSVAGSGPWTWTCAGTNGGTTASCSAQRTSVTNPNPTPGSNLFVIGQRVQTTASVNVRAAAGTSAAVLGTQAIGALGIITGGPTNANNFTWWQVNYDTGADGYSAEDYLRAYSTPNPVPNPVPTPTLAPGSSMSFPAFNLSDPADAPLIKFAETWAKNWNFEGHSVTDQFTGNQGRWTEGETVYEPWLFDRVSVGYYLYKRTTNATEKARWYQQFLTDFAYYRTHIDSQGIFTPKGAGDTKYSYVTPFLLYEKETGDAQYRPIARRIYDAWVRDFPATYSASLALWTEREIGLALEAAVSYYELTGDQAALTRANALVTQWTTVANGGNGVPLVTVTQHEGGGGSLRVTSPWMSALYFQAARRLHVLTGNTEVLQQVSRYADRLEEYGYFDGSVLSASYAGITAAYYLVGPNGHYTNETPAEGDFDHCLDVSGITAFAIEAKQALGQSTAAVTARNAQLRSCAARAFSSATRTTTYLPKYRVNPPRKFNWWMRSTLGYTGTTAQPNPTPVPSPTPTTTPPATTNFTLTVTKVGNGTITSMPNGISCGTSCSASFASGNSVNLTATPATGNTFTGWTGACSGTGTCTVSMTAARTVGATFAAAVQTASVQPLSAANPRILLNDSATLNRLQAALTSNAAGAARFRTMVNNELSNPGTNYAFQGWFAALMYRLTGEVRYATFAINKVDAFVAAEEMRISGGMRPQVAGDSFLEVGDLVGDVALVYDWTNDRLTQSQKTRWVNYMNTVLNNLWGDPARVSWGGVTHPWSGWSLNDPFNNYYYSFLEATMFTGLATYGDNPQAAQWLNKFYNEKVTNQLIPALNNLPGGGSLEGTGYGTALKRLFKLYFWWEKSTGVNIANRTPHTLNTAFWWSHSMVPTLDKFVPTGDQSRDSTASLYDYQRDLLQNLISLYPNEPVAGAMKTLLAQSSVPRMAQSMNFWSDFINEWPSVASQPLSVLNTTYFGNGSGNLYARSSWNTNAILVHTIAGPYNQSHAHRDQGSFMLNSAGAWLFDDANRRSASGIELNEEMHNLVRFSAGGNTVRQVEGASPSQVLALSDGNLFTYELMNTRPIYNNKPEVVKSEREFLFIKQGAVVLFDRAAANSASVSRIFQLQMSSAPTISGNQLSFTASGQRADVWRLAPANIAWTTTGLYSGTRAEAVHNSGTESLFLHVVGVNNQVTSVVADNTATQTGARITFTDGTVATVRFSNTGRGGTFNLVSGSGQTLYNNALPTTINSLPLYQ